MVNVVLGCYSSVCAAVLSSETSLGFPSRHREPLMCTFKPCHIGQRMLFIRPLVLFEVCPIPLNKVCLMCGGSRPRVLFRAAMSCSQFYSELWFTMELYDNGNLSLSFQDSTSRTHRLTDAYAPSVLHHDCCDSQCSKVSCSNVSLDIVSGFSLDG